MSKRTIIALGSLFLILLLAGPTFAQGPQPQHTDPVWQASYWNNMTLTGTAAVQRAETAINYNWGTGAPVTGINGDGFSARWTKYIDEPAGTYRFTATADDGVRVWLDGDLIINDWSDHAARTVTVDKPVAAGHHLITVEYYENSGDAVMTFSYAPVQQTINNWRGEYYNNTGLSGSPALVRDDANVNFNWAGGSPAAGTLGNDNFSVRWTRNLNLPAGNYRFTITADDGVRLWVNNHLLVDKWIVQAATTYTGDIYVSGSVPVKVEYFEAGGNAVAQLSWTTTGTTPPPGGTVIVDNGSSSFMRGGSATSWRTANIGYNGSLLWTRNNDYVRPNYNWGRWYPNLSAGRYEVFVYVPSNYANTTQARYWVSHRDGYTLKIINQNAYSDQWVSLGTYTFVAGNTNYVSLSDVTYETYLSKMVAWDAVKWEPR
jgi:hypothetical protein